MTAHQKLQLVRHLEAAIRHYGEKATGSSKNQSPWTSEDFWAARADAQNILTHVISMETVG